MDWSAALCFAVSESGRTTLADERFGVPGDAIEAGSGEDCVLGLEECICGLEECICGGEEVSELGRALDLTGGEGAAEGMTREGGRGDRSLEREEGEVTGEVGEMTGAVREGGEMTGAMDDGELTGGMVDGGELTGVCCVTGILVSAPFSGTSGS